MTLLLSLCAFHLVALFIFSLDLSSRHYFPSFKQNGKKEPNESDGFYFKAHHYHQSDTQKQCKQKSHPTATHTPTYPPHTQLSADKSTFAFFIFTFMLTANKFLEAVNVPVLHKNYDFISILSFLLGAKSIAVCVCALFSIFLSLYFGFIISFILIPIPIFIRCIIIKCIQTVTVERWPKESNEDKQIKDVDSLNRVLLYGHVAKVFVIFQLNCFYLCIQ